MPEILRLPGFVDVHTHLREPGDNKAETIYNGSLAAMIGGYVLICDMPNNPGRPTWTEERIDEKIEIAERDAIIPVHFYAGAQPESDNIGELAGMAQKAAGLKLYGAPTTGNDKDYKAEDFKEIVEEWHRVAPEKPILLHAGKENLGDMIGLVANDNQHHLHVCHVNDPEEVYQVSAAKNLEQDVSCGVCPHHLFKTSHEVKSQGWMARMQPPLASQIDSEQLWNMLALGDIDIVESDYAPHTLESKLKAENENPEGIHDKDHTTCFGVPGIEHIGALMLRQAQLGNIDMERLYDAMHIQPLRMLKKNYMSDSFVEWDMETHYIGEGTVQSGSGWSPYVGSIGVGKVSTAVISNKTVYAR